MSNHQAIIAVISSVQEIPNADNIHLATVLGEKVIVSKTTGVGYIGVLFPSGLQLSEEYCHNNNLYRKAELNKDITKTGFFEESRRVRTQPFLKVKSEAYFAPISSFDYIGYGKEWAAGMITIGYAFDSIEGQPICQKYISKATREAIAKANTKKAPKKALTPYFEKHVDSAQFKHNAAMIPKGSLLSFHAKIHGTSHRSGITKALKELPKWKQIINKVIPVFAEWEWKHVVGTRNVILSGGDKEGFHGPEQFRFDVANSVLPHLKEGMTVYGEIAGYVNSKPIMAVHSSKATKDKAFMKKYGENIIYKYGCKEHEYRFHIYRITYMDQSGNNVDFTQAQIMQWCATYGLNAPFDVCPPEIYDGDLDKLLAKVEALTEKPATFCEDYVDPSHPSEGIIIRIDTGDMNPYFLKSKAYYFKTMEGICVAIDAEDLEAA